MVFYCRMVLFSSASVFHCIAYSDWHQLFRVSDNSLSHQLPSQILSLEMLGISYIQNTHTPPLSLSSPSPGGLTESAYILGDIRNCHVQYPPGFSFYLSGTSVHLLRFLKKKNKTSETARLGNTAKKPARSRGRSR